LSDNDHQGLNARINAAVTKVGRFGFFKRWLFIWLPTEVLFGACSLIIEIGASANTRSPMKEPEFLQWVVTALVISTVLSTIVSLPIVLRHILGK
jgi:hypothetical protein